MKRSYKIFHQDKHFSLLVPNNFILMLSEGALEELDVGRKVCYRIDGWATCFNYQVKKALLKETFLFTILKAQDTDNVQAVKYAKSRESYAWEALKFVDKYVFDISPFRDKIPS